MAVESRLSGELLPVNGVRFAAIAAGIRYPDRLDLVIFELAQGSNVTGVFTQNAFCAAPVEIARSHLRNGSSRYLLINTGNANAGTGDAGRADALCCCEALAQAATASEGAKISCSDVLPFSTGVIGEPLPVGSITGHLDKGLSKLGDSDWETAARGILTTDTRPKAVSARIRLTEGGEITITGIAKGSGMIKPNMATMLAFVFTDAVIEEPLLQELLEKSVRHSFNRITVDGDTSTNDSCILVATGKSGIRLSKDLEESFAIFTEGLQRVFQQLATELIRDAEGASKFVTIHVINGSESQECLDVAYTIAESPLVKTALFAADPNWGRILAAIGRVGISNLEINKVSIDLGQTRLVEGGGVADSYSEEKGLAEMTKDEILITVDLARGNARETVWTSDLSHDYVRINAEYRT